METGFIALGILSILYYSFLVWYTKRWNSTFTWFWIVFGMANAGLGVLVRFMPGWMESMLMGIITVLWIVFLTVVIVILCSMLAVVPKNLKYLIILGAQVRGEKVTEALKRRLDRGIQYLQENPETKVIVSGGKGKGEAVSEAEAMADYLISAGVEAERIMLEDQSRTTFENMKNSLAFIQDERKDKIGIVTNNFHIYRSMKLARQAGYKKIYAIPASCNLAVFPNYLVREFFAVIVMFFGLWKNK